MKLLVAIVGREDTPPVVEAFARAGLPATVIEARGGFLRQGNAAILAGLEERAVPRALTLIDAHCRRRTVLLPTDLPSGLPEWALEEVVPVETGGATVFVLPVARYEQV